MESVRAKIQKGHQGRKDCQWRRWRIRYQTGPEGESGAGGGGGGAGLQSGVRGVFRGRLEDRRKGSRGGREGRSAHFTQLRREAVVSSPRWAAGAPPISTLAAAEGLDGVGSQRGVCSTAGGSSIVELALAGLVDKAALVLGPARTALAGAVLPLHHLSAQRVALGPLPGPLQPPRLARLLQQRSPRRQRGGVVQGPGFAASRRQLPVARVSVRQGSFIVFWMRGRRARLQHYGAAGHVNGHAGVLDEEVLQGAALEAGRPESRPLCSKTGRRGNKPAFIHQGGCGWRAACWGSSSPGAGWSCEAVGQVNDEPAIHFIFLRDEGLGAVGVLGGRWWGTEEEAGEALKHGGGAKRPGGGGWSMAVQKPGDWGQCGGPRWR